MKFRCRRTSGTGPTHQDIFETALYFLDKSQDTNVLCSPVWERVIFSLVLGRDNGMWKIDLSLYVVRPSGEFPASRFDVAWLHFNWNLAGLVKSSRTLQVNEAWGVMWDCEDRPHADSVLPPLTVGLEYTPGGAVRGRGGHGAFLSRDGSAPVWREPAWEGWRL